MISWIQKTFQHHFRTVFAVLLVLIIISFVVGINASGGFGQAERRHVDRPFFGYNLSLQNDVQRMTGGAQVSFSLNPSYEYSGIEEYAFQRAAKLHLADQWHIPASTDAEVKDAVTKLRAFAGQDGQFDAKAYTAFRDSLKTNPRGLTEADVVRIIGDDVRAEKVAKLIAGPGYALPVDVKLFLARQDTSWTLSTATVDYASFAPTLKPTDADLTKFFEENAFRYEIPPRVDASYADFSSINFIAGVTVTENEVRALYDANPARFPKPATVKPADDKTPAPKADPAADYAAVRPQVEATLKLERAQKKASAEAGNLAFDLYMEKVPVAALDAFLKKRNLAAKPLAPFTREAGPAELGGSQEVATEAFKLPREERYFSEAINVPSGAVVLFWKATQPARKPAFAEVRERVSADWIKNEKDKAFVTLGKTIKAQIEARLKAGDTFEKAAATVATSTGAKIDSKNIAAFTPRTRPQDLDYSVLGALERLEKGQVSDMAINADKGLLVYAADKKTPDLTEANPQFVTMRNQIAAANARNTVAAYISELVAAELKKSEPKVE